MVLNVLGSSSKGNCYLLEASDGILIIEAGIPAVEIKKAIGYQIDKVVGCVVSHQHGDHSKFVKDILSCGIKVLALEDVFSSHGITNMAFCKAIEPMHGYRIGRFNIYTIPVAHDVPCLGFVIEHEEMGRMLFVTDTMMLEYVIPKLDHIMLEANYCDRILQENIDKGIVPVTMRERLLHSHMELQTAKDIIKANDITNVKEIILVHLSDNNSDEGFFKQEMEKASGKPVYIASKGLELNLW